MKNNDIIIFILFELNIILLIIYYYSVLLYLLCIYVNIFNNNFIFLFIKR